MKAVPVAVTVTMLTAAILFTDTASARQGGQVSIMVGRPQAYRGVGGMYPTGHMCRESLWMRRGDPGQAHPTPPTGTRCHQPCPEGFWGANCSNACACRNGGTCIPKTGNCICAPGFRGPFCQKCEAPSSPSAFQSSARCQKLPLYPSWPAVLTAVYGLVTHGGSGWSQGLSEGWPMPPVTTSPFPPACQPGRYGKRCVPCKCANHSSCHPSNGTCYCLAGWTGPDCSQRTWWPVCLSACRGGGLRTERLPFP